MDKKHLVLMGPPGAGKTTTSKLLGKLLNIPVFDIDDDLLEVVWNMPVSEKLSQVGEEGFIQAEGKACLELRMESSEPTLIALSGSVPLHRDAIENIRKQGVVIYLDIPSTIIEKRLHEMKVDRIVGMKEGQTLADLLDYRKTFYEQFFDVRVACSVAQPVEEVAQRVVNAWNLYRNVNGEQDYVSTRGGLLDAGVSFSHVVTKGLALDGGLYVPRVLQSCSLNELASMALLKSYQDVALRVLEKFPLGTELTSQELRKMIDTTYSTFSHPSVVPLSEKISPEKHQYHIELFHGPTAAFKDVALQLVPKLFVHAKNQSEELKNSKFLILTATSGDTGVSTMEGYKSEAEAGVSVLVLYPQGGVSELQERQMLCSQTENIRAVSVKGNFDTCQTIVKEIFSDRALATELENTFGLRLSSANSINWARIIPQVVYYVTSYLELYKRSVIKLTEPVDIVVPSGNFGNLLSAIFAWKIGLIYVNKFICASNENCILADFVKTGIYDIRERTLQKTTSPSIDILVSSNIERLLYLICNNPTQVAQYMKQLSEEKCFEVSPEIKEFLQTKFDSCTASESQVAQTIN
ncbi:predicted protein [Naegleria gruberi]|uniref:Predicted protein n=1 Tax=Naegleria gruberi TaxID=5762 RepID=D2V888_NAEGR|nr:uncharacterized protein NAEGRDRAFT_65068 [Naegleria gruberi]EFC47002.1 predicted protein [Naegleria gruberi]|eukprot:XP_002679746.1 predicted protein [Naegleria gruberi strain NEG-M]